MELTVATGEVTALKHELWDDAVEARALVAEALLAGAEGAEVLSGLRHVLVVEVEVDDARLAAVVDREVHWSRHCDGENVESRSVEMCYGVEVVRLMRSRKCKVAGGLNSCEELWVFIQVVPHHNVRNNMVAPWRGTRGQQARNGSNLLR